MARNLRLSLPLALLLVCAVCGGTALAWHMLLAPRPHQLARVARVHHRGRRVPARGVAVRMGRARRRRPAPSSVPTQSAATSSRGHVPVPARPTPPVRVVTPPPLVKVPTPLKPLPPPVTLPAPVSAPPIAPLQVLTPVPAGEPLFSPTSVWNAPVTTARIDSSSASLSAALAAEVDKEVRGNYGPWINTSAWSVPVYTVGSAVPAVHVTLDAYNPQLQADFDAVPIPAGAHTAGGGDGSLVIYQPSTDTLWEFWLASLQGDGWHAHWGGKMTSVSSNPGYFPGSLGGSGTSLALLGGLMTIHELQAGSINHALAIGIPNTTAGAFTWPAQRSDGKTTGPGAVPEGTHFRIDPSLDLSTLHLSPLGLVIARAAQRYGMVVRDTSGCVVFYGEDPITTTGDPYAGIFSGAYPSALLQNFPWSHLQVVAPGAA